MEHQEAKGVETPQTSPKGIDRAILPTPTSKGASIGKERRDRAIPLTGMAWGSLAFNDEDGGVARSAVKFDERPGRGAGGGDRQRKVGEEDDGGLKGPWAGTELCKEEEGFRTGGELIARSDRSLRPPWIGRMDNPVRARVRRTRRTKPGGPRDREGSHY
ncbi:unnamed protein product [Linum trigynum]|uniref:Uncharacterized protein n=1 Tax=Linum trigynum TaxID=586398 RepID=A0AAV2EUE9_9ROSI